MVDNPVRRKGTDEGSPFNHTLYEMQAQTGRPEHPFDWRSVLAEFCRRVLSPGSNRGQCERRPIQEHWDCPCRWEQGALPPNLGLLGTVRRMRVLARAVAAFSWAWAQYWRSRSLPKVNCRNRPMWWGGRKKPPK